MGTANTNKGRRSTSQPKKARETAAPTKSSAEKPPEKKQQGAFRNTALQGQSHYHADSLRKGQADQTATPCQTAASNTHSGSLQEKLRQQRIHELQEIFKYLGKESELAIAMQHSAHGDTPAKTANMVDFLHDCKEGNQQDRGINKCTPALMIRALGWLAKHAQIQSVPELMCNPLIQALFGKPEGPRDHCEALPLPLSTLAAWEEKVRDPSTTPALRILLGGFLLTAHTSLRFADTRRIKHSSLSLARNGLRGICWATKTSPQGSHGR